MIRSARKGFTAMDHFLKIDNIKGESLDKSHKGEIEVLSWAWGLSAATPPTSGGGGRTGKAKAHDITITHRYDSASPVLARGAITGTHFKEAWLTARRAGDGQKDFLKITMKDVIVTAIDDGATTDGITEQVSLRPRSIAFEYRPLGVKGEQGDPVSFEWDTKHYKVT